MVSEFSPPKAIIIDSQAGRAERVCRQLLDDAEGNGFNSDDIFAIHLALEEALINAIKHGNGMDPKKQITVEYTITPEKFDVSVADDGSGFRPGDVPDPRDSENLSKPSGRGLLLMKEFMDVVEHNSTGNRVHMIKYKTKNEE
jgi:serine/threonine-protein kinase RsbW